MTVALAAPARAADRVGPDSLRFAPPPTGPAALMRAFRAAQDSAQIEVATSVPDGRYAHTTIYDPVRDQVLVFGGSVSSGYTNSTSALALGGQSWSTISTASVPSARGGHVAIYDPVRDRMIVFGGVDTQRRNDVWALSLAGSPNWAPIAAAGTPPSARSLHAAIYDPVRDRLITFGGYDDVSGYLNDVWALSLSGTPTWTQITPTGPLPPRRREHTAIYDPVRDRMVIHGGAPGPQSDTWALTLAGTPSWSQVTTTGSIPQARSGQAVVYDAANDRMVIFGGLINTGYLNDVWALPLGGGTWTQLQPTGGVQPRELTPGAYDSMRGRLLVFSGWNGDYLTDTIALTLSGPPAWSVIVPLPPNGDPPSPRYIHTAIADPPQGRMVVFGGVANGNLENFSYALSLDASTWSNVVPVGSPPSQRGSHTSIFDPVRDRMIVFGGYDGQRENDTWIMTLGASPAWSQMSPNGPLPPRRNLHSAIYDPVRDRMIVFGGYDADFKNDVWALSLSGTPTWTQLTPTGGSPPAMREQSAIYDPVRDRMIVFGGYTVGGKVNTIWTLSLGPDPAWTALAAGGPAIPARSGHSAIYDPLRDCMVVFGGYNDGVGYLNDTWSLDLASSTWAQMHPVGTAPSARLFQTAILDAAHNQMVVFGGINGPSLNDTWNLLLSGGGGWYALGTTPPAIATTPVPVYVSPPPAVPATMNLGQSITLTATVRNDGTASDDGRIVFSFPQLDAPSDASLVSSTSAGDTPGFVTHPAQSSLLDNACQPVAASYLVSEYGDNDWSASSIEINSFAVTVTPRQAGTFTILARVTLHVTRTTCQYVSATPSGGAADVDQQGFAVTRYTVTVLPPPTGPEPAMTSVTGVPASITVGDAFTISCSAVNNGLASDDGAIVLGFPSLTGAGDGQWVTSTATGDQPGFRNLPAGSTLSDTTCGPLTASYLVSEYRDNSWGGLGSETNTASFTIQPQATGVFSFDVRTTMHTTGTPCTSINGLPPDAIPVMTDQQGWSVKRYSLSVKPYTAPVPSIVSVTGIPSQLTLGQIFTMTVAATNGGGASDDGRITVGFPAFTNPGDAHWVVRTGPADPDVPGYVATPAGGALSSSTCQPLVASYLESEWADNGWNSSEINSLALVVQPTAAGTFYVDVRTIMHRLHGTPCDYTGATPSASSLATDQQGWQVTRYTVNVVPPPPPPGPATIHWARQSPGGTPPPPRYGQAIAYDSGSDQMVIVAGDEGDCSTDAWGLPLAPGSPWTRLPDMLLHSDERIGAGAIYDPDAARVMVFGGQCLALLNDVSSLYLRSGIFWYRNAPNGTRPGAREGMTTTYDPVRKQMVMFGGYSGSGYANDVWTLAMGDNNGTWTNLAVSGAPPAVREGHSAIYDPLRDRIVVYGGNGGATYNDVWALSLSGTPAWAQILPTGSPPTPRWRHTAIYDPDGDRMIVFAGSATSALNDVWALTFSGTPTWTQLYSSTLGPAVRFGHGAIYDPLRHDMVIFGGQVSTRANSNEVWTLTFDAPTATTADLVSSDATSDEVRLEWSVAGAAYRSASVERQSDGSVEWRELGAADATHDGFRFVDRDVTPGRRYAYRLTDAAGTVVSAPAWVTVPLHAVLALAGVSPNPAGARVEVVFSLPDDAAARLELFDLGGRRVAARDVGSLGAGDHRVGLGDDRRFPPGVYMVRLTHDNRVLRAKVAIVR
ncbi:MAG: T9SS type A sorting domain-containing protein [Candidatus Eisenbacteria bacterium]|uniref:T9SS type A sorting domain-containing protein n=1 Tax=Eiseniibacteriota bacterium TaxID=2212470 RepID=A0A9D6QM76_UNCEI|nr:T9SS type A sorting domain-containing protein [Candidatus Eisenbacteria bacterium]